MYFNIFANTVLLDHDDYVVRSWRPNENVKVLQHFHQYPKKGTQGEPLTRNQSCTKHSRNRGSIGACACEETH